MKKAGRKERVIVMTGSPENQVFPEKDIPPVISQLYKPFHIQSFLEVVISALSGNGKK